MFKIKLIKDMFISNIECIEKGSILNLKEYKDYFEIITDEGHIVERCDNELKEEIYQYFIKEK